MYMASNYLPTSLQQYLKIIKFLIYLHICDPYNIIYKLNRMLLF